MPGSVKYDNSVAGMTVLNHVRADSKITTIPSCQQIHARLLGTLTNVEHLSIKVVVVG